MQSISLIPAEEQHLQIHSEILNYYVLNSTCTFHRALLSAEDMREKLFFPNPVYQGFTIMQDQKPIGFCAVSPWKKQESYRQTAELNIYLDKDHCGKAWETLFYQNWNCMQPGKISITSSRVFVLKIRQVSAYLKRMALYNVLISKMLASNLEECLM